MSSNLRINKVCQQCGKHFEARKITSRTCSDACAKLLYKARQRALMIEGNNKEIKTVRFQAGADINSKQFLTVRDASTLLNCSVRTTYYLIDKGSIKAVNLAQRKTLIKRSEIDKLFA